MTAEPKSAETTDRRRFIGDSARLAGAVAAGSVFTFFGMKKGEAGTTRWQLDPDKCMGCGNCASYCVLDTSAVKCVQCFDMCGYCDICTGYFDTDYLGLDTAAENQLCPTGAIDRKFVEEKAGQRFYEYTIDEPKCIGCGKCVKGFALMNGSLYLQVMHDRCVDCNECSISVACPTDAFSRVPAETPYLMKQPALLLVKQKARNPSDRGPGAPPSRARPMMWPSATLCRRLRLDLGLPVLLLASLAQPAAGDLIPTPDFSAHPIPTTAVPNVERDGWQILDVAVLLIALSLASYFALVVRSRKRLLLLTVFSVLWFGFWRKGCVCPIGATQNISLATWDPTYSVPITVVAFFALPLVFTLFFGRTFCAAVCPLGAVQELTCVRSVTVPRWLDHALGLLAYIYLGAAILFAATGTAFVICRYDPFVALFRLSGSHNMLIFSGCVLLIGLFVGRPYCRYLCPYGAILRLLSKVSKCHVRIPPDECINCRLCEDVCPYGAIEPPTIDQSSAERFSGRRRLVGAIILLPFLIALFAWLGTYLAVPLSRLDTDVRLAEQVWGEELGQIKITTDASDAYRTTGRPVAELYETAVQRRARFGQLGVWLGAWVGLVVGVKLVHLSLRRRRTDFRANQSGCVSCGRCFWYCPPEQVRLGLIEDISAFVPEETRGVPGESR